MSSIFSRIVSGDIPAYVVAESAYALAFLDIAPLAPGHTLIIPKQEVDLFTELPADLYLHCQRLAHHVGQALHATFGTRRVGMVIAGFEVPHAHIHLIPVNQMEEMSFERPRIPMPAEELERCRVKIVDELASRTYPGLDLKFL